MATMHNPPHPGQALREWLADIAVTEAAERLGVTRAALPRILNGAAGVSNAMICACPGFGHVARPVGAHADAS